MYIKTSHLMQYVDVMYVYFYEVAISCDFRCIWSVSVCRPNYASSIASNAGISTGFNAKGDLCVTMYISLQTLERESERERVKRDEE